MKNTKNSNKVRPLLVNAPIIGVSPKNGVRLKPLTITTFQTFDDPDKFNHFRLPTSPTTPNDIDNKVSIDVGMTSALP